jgi:CubicO group peptidase (beta-lactamase class C family)
MNTPLLFIPAAICMLAVFGGICCFALASLGLRKARRAGARQPVPGTTLPEANKARQVVVNAGGCWIQLLKVFSVAAIAIVLLGLAGLWMTKFSVGWQRAPIREWTDGRAPQLEPLIRKHCLSFVQTGKSVGMAVAVVVASNATLMTFGHPSLTSNKGLGPDAVFEIGSITKTFTGLALAREVEQGRVQLDQPLQDFLPRDVVLPEAARGVTLRHLTAHASGFPRVASDWSAMHGILMILVGRDPYASYTEADLMQDVRTVGLEFPPGTKSSYSNFGMILLGHVLSTKASLSYEALVKRDVCQPLGLTNTTVQLQDTRKELSTQGYRAVCGWGRLRLGLRSASFGPGSGGAGALRSTGADMLKYLQANMHPEGQPLEHALRQAHLELAREDDRTTVAMNWIRTRGQRHPQTLIWHNGATVGHCSFIGFAEDRQCGVLILSNTSESVDDLAVELLHELTAGTSQTPAVR